MILQDSFSHSRNHHNSLDGTSFHPDQHRLGLENSAAPGMGQGTYSGTPSIILFPLSVLFICLPASVHALLGADLSFLKMCVNLAHWA